LSTWSLCRRRGIAGELHARSAADVAGPVAGRTVTVLEASPPAVVLGSAQPESAVDAGLVARRGWDVARRRSGGGAVLVGDGRCLWVDVVVPRGDPCWDDDVSRAAWWLGDAWSLALDDVGLPGAQAWKGPMRKSRWSSLVCFAGMGPGEVRLGERKVVGVAQRRTRHGALFQCAALLEGDHRPLLDLLVMAPSDRLQAAAELAQTTIAVGRDQAAAVVDALVRRLPLGTCC
jgi:lipoate-protein ligase A